MERHQEGCAGYTESAQSLIRLSLSRVLQCCSVAVIDTNGRAVCVGEMFCMEYQVDLKGALYGIGVYKKGLLAPYRRIFFYQVLQRYTVT